MKNSNGHPKWTAARLAKFRATMAAKKVAQDSHVQVNRLAKFDDFDAMKRNEERFKEHFVGMFEGLTSEVRRDILCELVKRL